MDCKIQERKPNYLRIYYDIIVEDYPERISEFETYFKKKVLTTLDVIKINNQLFKKTDGARSNQKFKSYNKQFVIEVLDYQKKNKLNNTELSRHFNLSRNTIFKWKQIFST